MNTYFVTMANGDEMTVVADTKNAAMAYARRTTVSTQPVAARLVFDDSELPLAARKMWA